jgi:hypothetical protein
MPYGQSWKDHRKIFHQELNPAGVMRCRPHILVATRKFLRAILRSPDDFMAHLRQFVLVFSSPSLWIDSGYMHSMAGMIILYTAYGIEVKSEDDPYVDIGEKSLHAMAEAGNSPAYVVDIIPIRTCPFHVVSEIPDD